MKIMIVCLVALMGAKTVFAGNVQLKLMTSTNGSGYIEGQAAKKDLLTTPICGQMIQQLTPISSDQELSAQVKKTAAALKKVMSDIDGNLYIRVLRWKTSKDVGIQYYGYFRQVNTQACNFGNVYHGFLSSDCVGQLQQGTGKVDWVTFKNQLMSELKVCEAAALDPAIWGKYRQQKKKSDPHAPRSM